LWIRADPSPPLAEIANKVSPPFQNVKKKGETTRPFDQGASEKEDQQSSPKTSVLQEGIGPEGTGLITKSEQSTLQTAKVAILHD